MRSRSRLLDMPKQVWIWLILAEKLAAKHRPYMAEQALLFHAADPTIFPNARGFGKGSASHPRGNATALMDRVTRHDRNFICSACRRQATLCRCPRRDVPLGHPASFKDILPARSWMRAARAETAERSVRPGVSKPISRPCMIRSQSNNPRALTIS